MRKKKLISVFLACAIACSTALAANVTAFAAKVNVKKIQVNNLVGKTLYVAKGKSVKISAAVTVTPNKAANKKLTYKSSSKKVAQVSSNGVVKGKKTGTAKITVASKVNKSKKTTFTVKVTAPVKSIKLSSTTASVYKGGTLKLSASVQPSKGSCKIVKWTSSDSKVASVSSKGVVSAKGTGTARITATSADGTNKKATCTVTVKNRGVELAHVSIYNPSNSGVCSRIAVSLSQAKALTKDDFTVKEKMHSNGKYNRTLEVSYISTTDNKNYIIDVKSSLYSGNYYSISVSGLGGSNSGEVFFKPQGKDSDITVCADVGDEVEEYLRFSNMLGFTSVKIISGSLPAGLSFEEDSITGRPTAVANNQKAVFAATDEFGTVSKCTVNFVIADENTLYAENKTIGNNGYSVYTYNGASFGVYAAGGSGKYKVSLADNYNGIFELEDYEDDYAYITMNSSKLTTAGTYSLKVNFTDVSNPALTATGTVDVIVKPTFSVTNIMENTTLTPTVYYLNKDTGELFHSGSYTNNATIVNVPSGVYEVYTNNLFDDKIMLSNSFTVSSSATQSYSLPATYKVSGAVTGKNAEAFSGDFRVYLSPADDEDNYVRVSVSDGQYMFSDVPVGKYILEAKCSDNWTDAYTTVYKTEISVDKSDVTNNISIDYSANTPKVVSTLTEPGTTSVTTGEGYVYIAFTPAETSYYRVYSQGEYDSYGCIRTESGETLDSNDDGGSGNNFSMTAQLTAGTTYYIGARQYDYDEGCKFDVIIEKTTVDEEYDEEW